MQTSPRYDFCVPLEMAEEKILVIYFTCYRPNKQI